MTRLIVELPLPFLEDGRSSSTLLSAFFIFLHPMARFPSESFGSVELVVQSEVEREQLERLLREDGLEFLDDEEELDEHVEVVVEDLSHRVSTHLIVLGASKGRAHFFFLDHHQLVPFVAHDSEQPSLRRPPIGRLSTRTQDYLHLLGIILSFLFLPTHVVWTLHRPVWTRNPRCSFLFTFPHL